MFGNNSIKVGPMATVNAVLTNPKKRKDFVNQNRLNIIVYFAAIVGVLFVYHFLSDGDFSFLMTVGALTRLFGFSLLAFKLSSQNSASGISLKTLQLYAVVFAARLSSILRYEGYLPLDKSGDFVYPLVEGLALLLVCALIISTVSGRGYNSAEDGFGNAAGVPSKFGALFLAVPCFVLAVLFHPSLNRNFVTDIAWTFGLYLETVAIVPQFYMIQRAKSAVEPWLSHFVFCLGLSRVFLTMFWLSTAGELTDRHSIGIAGGWASTMVLVAQFAHVAVMAEFCYYYVKAAAKQTALILPGSVV